MDAILNPAIVKAFADAGVAIAALFVIIVVVWLVYVIVRFGFRLMNRLIDALDRVAQSEEKQNHELANMRADITLQNRSIANLEQRLDRLPADLRNELTGSFTQLLNAVEKLNRPRRWF